MQQRHLNTGCQSEKCDRHRCEQLCVLAVLLWLAHPKPMLIPSVNGASDRLRWQVTWECLDSRVFTALLWSLWRLQHINCVKKSINAEMIASNHTSGKYFLDTVEEVKTIEKNSLMSTIISVSLSVCHYLISFVTFVFLQIWIILYLPVVLKLFFQYIFIILNCWMLFLQDAAIFNHSCMFYDCSTVFFVLVMNNKSVHLCYFQIALLWCLYLESIGPEIVNLTVNDVSQFLHVTTRGEWRLIDIEYTQVHRHLHLSSRRADVSRKVAIICPGVEDIL